VSLDIDCFILNAEMEPLLYRRLGNPKLPAVAYYPRQGDGVVDQDTYRTTSPVVNEGIANAHQIVKWVHGLA